MESQAIQLDLFLDSRSVMLANEALDALVQQDGPRAARTVVELCSEAPDYPSLRSLEVLARALTEWRLPTGDVTGTMTLLEN